jgi:hypothetical protein
VGTEEARASEATEAVRRDLMAVLRPEPGETDQDRSSDVGLARQLAPPSQSSPPDRDTG